MPEVVKVVFRKGCKSYYFSPNNLELHPGRHVIVKTENGNELGRAVSDVFHVSDAELTAPLKNVVRVATKEDIEQKKKNADSQIEFIYKCKEKIKKLNLDMKLVGAELNFENTKVTFTFTAEERVDFRQLVKELSSEIRKKVELRQVGVRDAAKQIGGFGVCGLFMCCNNFVSDFDSVSIKMAKDQGLPLNPNKISGACGRLMCCLKYEHDAYKDFCSRAPAIGKEIKTPEGKGKVSGYVVPKDSVIVTYENGLSQEQPLSELTK